MNVLLLIIEAGLLDFCYQLMKKLWEWWMYGHVLVVVDAGFECIR